MKDCWNNNGNMQFSRMASVKKRAFLYPLLHPLNHRLFISRLETDSFVFFSSRFTDSISLSKSQFLSALVAP